MRLEEEEEKIAAMMDERKKYNQTIQDLEEQYAIFVLLNFSKRSYDFHV